MDIHPGALLATVEASTTAEELNEHLHPYRLWLPIVPLRRGLTLAELVQHNAGGRYRLRYGPIATWLRGATLRFGPTEPGASPPMLVTGGPTLKRATGYRLPQSLVGQPWRGSGSIATVTLRVRPVPPARRTLLLECGSLHQACQLATLLLSAGVAPTALAFMARSQAPPGGGQVGGLNDDAVLKANRYQAHAPLLLVGLEGPAAVVEHQAAQAETLAVQAGASLVAQCNDLDDHAGVCGGECWRIWEETAERWHYENLHSEALRAGTLDLTLPRAALVDVAEQAGTLAARYGLCFSLWGDVGVGTLHLRLEREPAASHPTPGEIQQAAALIVTLARRAGGAWSTERETYGEKMEPAGKHHLLANGLASRLANKLTSGIAPPNPVPPSPLSPPRFLAELRRIVGDAYVLTEPDELECYAADASIAPPEGEPLAVVLPGSTEDVSAVVRMAAGQGASLVTRGAGSGLAGGTVPSAGAVLLVLSRIQQMHIDPLQMRAHVGAGVVTADLQRAAEARGLFYPPDPSSQSVSTIGGNIACNAGGSRCLKYGVTSDYVLSLTVVLADGQVLRVGDGLAAQSPDVGLMHLLIGSEGTLAVVTEAVLRLIPRPAARRTVLAFFNTIADACAAVQAVVGAGLVPAAMELMDEMTIAVVEEYLCLGLPRQAGAMLLLQADGNPTAVEEEGHTLANLVRKEGAWGVRIAHDASDEADLWRARRSVGPALARVSPNKLGEDICVPVPQVAEAVQRIKAIATHHEIPVAIFGHAGDGNLHPNILFDAREPGQTRRVWQVAEEIFGVALELGGTLSGEHGIGVLKRPFMAAALGGQVLAWQQRIKTAFDPRGRLNPGKLLPTDPPEPDTSREQ
jgi:glycolate oxidase subunit GlcD